MRRWQDSQAAYEVEGRAHRAGLEVELRAYAGARRGRALVTASRATVGMLLSARPLQARYPEAQGAAAFQPVGAVMFRPSGVPCEVQYDGGPVRTLVCMFDDGRFEQLSGRSDDWTPSELAECLDVRDASVRNSLRALEREIRAPGFASEMLIEATGAALAIQLARRLARARRARSGELSVLGPDQLAAIEACLDEMSGRLPTVGDLAGACGVSSRHLLRMFHRTMGRSVGAYLADRQLQRAKQMLAESDLPLKEISYRLGFSSHSSFTHAFRREAGVAPREFRRRSL